MLLLVAETVAGASRVTPATTATTTTSFKTRASPTGRDRTSIYGVPLAALASASSVAARAGLRAAALRVRASMWRRGGAGGPAPAERPPPPPPPPGAGR